ncbi:MAG: TonB-dependent receptor [Coprobacter sp.]|nr:TonB-dependent receptor [Coprobacter sp.]
MKKLRNITLVSLALLFGALLPLSAQTTFEKLTGKVVDENNDPLAGVSIVAGKTGTMTAADGTFTLTGIPQGTHVRFSFVGYQPQSIEARTPQSVARIQLKPTTTAMSEVTVVGYGKQERRDITGSVSSVKLEEQKAFLSVDQLLLGRAPGVYVSNSSGALGGANLLTIRGVSSIIGENNPLYVVDGVPIYGTDRSSNSVSTSGGAISAVSMSGTSTGGGSLTNNMELNYSFEQNPLLSLNPDDIESIEILKDAFATSIYGSRGSAGVVLITTKKGNYNRPSVNVSYTLSLDKPIGKLDLLNGDEYVQIYKQFYPNDTYTPGHNTDWLDAVTRTAVSHNTNASISGGNERSRYYLSLAYANNQSYVINNDLQRYSARLNLDTKLNNHFSMGANVSLSFVDNNALQAPTIYKDAILRAPNLPIYNEDGSYYYGYNDFNSKGNTDNYNPVAYAWNNISKSKNITTIGNAYLQYDVTPWLELRTEIGTNISDGRSFTFKPELPASIASLVPNNQASENVSQRYRVVNNNTVTINKIFNQRHYLQAVLGESYEIAHEYNNAIAGSDFFSPDTKGIGAAQTRRVTAAGEDTQSLLSAFARVNYQLMRRYMFGLSYRLDGSSRYNRNHRFINIPSVSAAWRLSEENFIRYKAPWIDEFKIRASVGWTSQDANNSYYGAQAIYTLNTASSYGGEQFVSMSQPSNINLNWEKTITYDLGLDFEAFQKRLRLTVDYYYKRTSDMLFSSDLPAYTGYSTQLQNIADMQNQGIEVQVISDNIVTKNFKWQSILNITHNSNKILKLNFEGNQLDQANSSFKYYAVGYPMAQWYLHEWVGVDPMTGNPIWRLADGTTTNIPPAANYATSNANKFVYGVAEPKFYGSFTNIFMYKGLEANLMFSFSAGGRMINSTRANMLTYATESANNLSREILDFWQIPGQKTDIPALRNSSIMNSSDYTSAITTTRFLENSSYLRLKTLELAYSLPRKALNKTKIFNQMKFFVILTNLFTVTPYSGLDPEVSAFGSSATATGYDNMTMPSSRSYQFGIRIGL